MQVPVQPLGRVVLERFLEQPNNQMFFLCIYLSFAISCSASQWMFRNWKQYMLYCFYKCWREISFITYVIRPFLVFEKAQDEQQQCSSEEEKQMCFKDS